MDTTKRLFAVALLVALFASAAGWIWYTPEEAGEIQMKPIHSPRR